MGLKRGSWDLDKIAEKMGAGGGKKDLTVSPGRLKNNSADHWRMIQKPGLSQQKKEGWKEGDQFWCSCRKNKVKRNGYRSVPGCSL